MQPITDTSPEAEQVWIEVYRNMPVARKWLLLGELFQDAKMLHAAGVRFRDPTATDDEIHSKWIELLKVGGRFSGTMARTENVAKHIGWSVPCSKWKPSINSTMENLRGLREVLSVFTSFKIPYALGGSMASSVFGIDRYTRDADITVEPFPGRESELSLAFPPEYYLSLPAIQDAVRDRSSFNIINTSTGFKIDVFIRKDQAFENSAMARRHAHVFPDKPDQPIYFHSPEDIILFKLRWFRLGGEVSDQQWSDVLGILKVQTDKLDFNYIEHWAKELAIDDLLSRATREAGCQS